MVRRLPGFDDTSAVEPVQYVAPSQLAEAPAAPSYRFQLPGEAPNDEGLLPFPLPALRDPEPTVPGQPQTQAVPDILAGYATPEVQAAIEQYMKAVEHKPLKNVSGKGGTEDEGLDYYSKIPGERIISGGHYWIYNPDNPEQPYKPYTAQHAIDPKTGQIYELAPDLTHQPPAGSVAEIGPRLATLAKEPFSAVGRILERARLGLEVPRSVEQSDAQEAANAILASSVFPKTSREGLRAFGRRPEPTPEPHTNRPRPTPEPEPPPIPEPVGALPQLRTRPAEARPQGHITQREFTNQRAAERQARLERDRPEVDDAGFYINALEQAKRNLPESATAGEMRQALRDLGVEDAEASMLGLDQFLLGERGTARQAVRDAERELGRLGSDYGKVLKKSRQATDNTQYREGVKLAAERIEQGRARLRAAQDEAKKAEISHMRRAHENFRSAELNLKKVNKAIRDAQELHKKSGAEGSPNLSNMYEFRKIARDTLREDAKNLEKARVEDPTLRPVTREHIVTYLRQIRPRLGFEVREFPRDPYGPMTGPIRTIQGRSPDGVTANPLESPFAAAMHRRGIAMHTARGIASSFADMSPLEWGVRAESLASHMDNPGAIREALEEAAGASLQAMASAWRGAHNNTNVRQNPRYRQSIPDKQNETLREVAVVLHGPWNVRKVLAQQERELGTQARAKYDEYINAVKDSPEEANLLKEYEALIEEQNRVTALRRAAPRPPFTTGHWSDEVAPVGHMSVSMQRAPIELGGRAARQAVRAQAKLAELAAEEVHINNRLRELGDINAENLTQAMENEENRLMARGRQIDAETERLQRDIPRGQASDDLIYMGNQFQSDWATSGAGGFRPRNTEQVVADLRRRMNEAGNEHNRIIHQMRQLERRTDPDAVRLRNVLDERARGLFDDAEMMRRQMRDIEMKPAYHSLVASTNAWLRPVLEQFVEQGIRSGARYLGVPDGQTVLKHNPASEGTKRFYDEIVRKQLRYVMERRGLPYKEVRDINVMYNPEGTESFPGRWFLIELPRNAPSGRGVRLMSVPGAVPTQEENNGSP